MNADDLKHYADAWNTHDLDAIMAMMTDDCVFETGGGPDPWRTRFAGASAVSERFSEVWRDIPDARWEDAVHFVDGDRGCSVWTFRGTGPDGSRIEVEGCDLFRLPRRRDIAEVDLSESAPISAPCYRTIRLISAARTRPNTACASGSR